MSVDQWIAKLPALVTPAQAEHASWNLRDFLRDVGGSDDAQLRRSLRPHVSALLQLSIRGYWQRKHRPLVGEADAQRAARAI
jgi:hypothetical protein